MEKSTVYFTDFRCSVGTSQLDKLKKLCVAAGIKNIDMDGKFVAIKMHFGELGNLAFLRPNYAKAVADLCKDRLQHLVSGQQKKCPGSLRLCKPQWLQPDLHRLSDHHR